MRPSLLFVWLLLLFHSLEAHNCIFLTLLVSRPEPAHCFTMTPYTHSHSLTWLRAKGETGVS